MLGLFMSCRLTDRANLWSRGYNKFLIDAKVGTNERERESEKLTGRELQRRRAEPVGQPWTTFWQEWTVDRSPLAGADPIDRDGGRINWRDGDVRGDAARRW